MESQVSWTQLQRLEASDATNWSKFGYSVDIIESTLSISAPEKTVGDLGKAGKKHRYRDLSLWVVTL